MLNFFEISEIDEKESWVFPHSTFEYVLCSMHSSCAISLWLISRDFRSNFNLLAGFFWGDMISRFKVNVELIYAIFSINYSKNE